MNYKIISYILGWVINIEGACMLLPFLCGIIYSETSKWAFLICSLICFLIGLPLTFKKPKNANMFAKEGFVIVALSWIFISILGAIPFVLTGAIPNFIKALFETASGFTTTGASVIPDLNIIPKCVIFWRSFTHWIGGMGVIVFLVAILPSSSGSNFYMIKAESPGHSVSKLVPRVSHTAKILYGIYIFLTIAEIIVLKIGGLNWFESLTLTFGTAGTGGFGILNSSIAEYSSYVQNAITIFMIIFGIDFSFYYLILLRKFKNAIKMEEVLGYISIILVSILLVFFNIKDLYPTLREAVEKSAFQVASIITTTGYTTTNYDLWPEFSKTILVLLMFCGACTGSTGGAMKVSRIMILAKSIVKEIKMLAHPKSMIKVKFCGKPVEHETLRGINVFFISYVLIFAVIFLFISLDNFDFTTSFTAVAATLGNIGPGLSLVGPTCNFSIFSPLSTLMLTFAMIVGRLEIFPILVLFSFKTWKK